MKASVLLATTVSGIFLSLSAPAQTGLNLTPLRADDMCAFAGINSRIHNNPFYIDSQWSWTWPLLQELNIRGLRAGIGWKGYQTTNSGALCYDPYSDSTVFRSRVADAWNALGIDCMIGIGGIYQAGWGSLPNPGGTLNPSGVQDYIDQNLIDSQLNSIKNNYMNGPYGDAVYAIETQNEYSSNETLVATWGPRLNLYQQTVLNRRNVLGISKPIIMTSLWFSTDTFFYDAHNALGNIYGSATYGNLHFYPGQGTPATNLVAYLDHIRTTNVGSGGAYKKVVVSEFGTHTIPGFSSQRAQAKNIARFYCEMQKSGKVQRAYNYALFDQPNNSSGSQRDWGLVTATYTGSASAPTWTGYTRKEAFYALKNFLGLMKEASWNSTNHVWDRSAFTATNLPVDLTGLSTNTQYFDVQKSSGEHLLLLWRDMPTYENGADVVNPEDGITIAVRKAVTSWKVLRPLAHNADWAYADRSSDATYGFTSSGTDANGFAYKTLSVPDYVMAVQLTTSDGSFTSAYNTGSRNNYTGNLGYEFTPSTALTVKALGRPVPATGMTGSHVVTIWRVSDQMQIASVTVAPGSPLDDKGNRYVVLSTPVTLSSNTAYRITSSETGSGDKWLDASSGNVPNHLSSITINKGVYSASGYPTSTWGGTDTAYVAPVLYP